MPRPFTISAKAILRGQALGFAALYVIMMTAEFAGVPERYLGESHEFFWFRLILRTVALFIFWLIVHLSTRRLLRRLHELEDFLVVCSWCRRVGHEGRWLSMEQYFGSRFNTETSHGICPDCAQRQLASHRRVERVERAS